MSFAEDTTITDGGKRTDPSTENDLAGKSKPIRC